MEQLDENIQVIAVEVIAEKRLLLALKETDIQDEEAVCLALVLEENKQVTVNDKLDLITLATSFNAYNFLNENQKILMTTLLERYLNDENTKKINTLLLPEKSE